MKLIHVAVRGIWKAVAEVLRGFIPAKRAQLQRQDFGRWIQ